MELISNARWLHDLIAYTSWFCTQHWDLNEMGYVETMFGHQSEINAIDSWRKERTVTGGRDRTVSAEVQRWNCPTWYHTCTICSSYCDHFRISVVGPTGAPCEHHELLQSFSASTCPSLPHMTQVRLWKVLEDSHLVFRPVGGGSIDCLRYVQRRLMRISRTPGEKLEPTVTTPCCAPRSHALFSVYLHCYLC